MTFIRYPGETAWWRLGKAIDETKHIVYNYRNGHHYISNEKLNNVEKRDFESWHQIYLQTGFCPLKVDIYERDAWLSPEGEFYEGEAHSLMAEYLCDLLFGEDIDMDEADDYLEGLGWIKVTTSLMWEIRLECYQEKRLTQVQYNALFDWCQLHKKEFPADISIC